MANEIGLYYNISNIMSGCYKLAINLLKGLDELHIKVCHNQQKEYTGAIHGINKLLKPNTLIGPEIVVLPTEKPDMFARYNRWVQPCRWVINYMREFNETDGIDLIVWPVGINTEDFNDKNRRVEKECFIYYKDITKQVDSDRLRYVENELKIRNIKYSVIKYGSYNEADYIKLINKSAFAIWLVGTESQNIALMEAMAMGLPVYVVDEKWFKYGDFLWYGASSAPYFNGQCGVKCDDMTLFDHFLDHVKEYTPRDYIINNHTLKKGAQKYMEILTHGF